MAALDDFSAYLYPAVGFAAQAYNIAVVTPNDTTDLSNVTRWLWIGGAGNVAVVPAGAETNSGPVTITGVAAGTLLPIRVSRVKATNTTATNIVALW